MTKQFKSLFSSFFYIFLTLMAFSSETPCTLISKLLSSYGIVPILKVAIITYVDIGHQGGLAIQSVLIPPLVLNS